MDELSRSFPKIKIEHFQKTSQLSGTSLLIPKGLKSFAWFTRFQDSPICILLHIDGNEIQKITHVYVSFKEELSQGTILYGTLMGRQFIAENLYYEKGNPVYLSFSDKLLKMKTILEKIHPCECKESIHFYLPKMIQTRHLLEASNMPYSVYGILSLQTSRLFVLASGLCTFTAKRREEFEDVYDLFALEEAELKLYSSALINDFKTSHFMKKSAFRNKPTYKNIEFSDSEEEESLGEFCVQCIFIPEFRRWKPLAYKNLPLSTFHEIKIKERLFYK